MWTSGGGSTASGAEGGGGASSGSAGASTSGPTTATGSSTSTTTGAGGAAGLSLPEACVVAASCNWASPGFPFTPSSCLDSITKLGWYFEAPNLLPDPVLADRLYQCATEHAGNCGLFTDCFGGDWVSLSRCREGGYCDANKIAAGTTGPRFDCGSLDAICVNLASGAQRACCNAEACDAGTPVQCNGQVATYCGLWGEHVTFDCGLSGRLCNEGSPDQWIPCVGPGPGACDPVTPIVCEGNVAVYCSGGALAKYDCSQVTYRSLCNEGASSYTAACRPKGTECDPEWELSTCDGDRIRVCVDGVFQLFDCTALGFAACEEQPDTARCVPFPE